MFKSFLKSIKKSKRLKEISKRLAVKNISTTDSAEAFKELINLCKSDENVSYILNLYNATDETLEKLYSKLLRIGAGQYAGGHFVAASSLAYAYSLKFLLEHSTNDSFSIRNYDERNSSLFICARLVRYFEKGESGPLE